MSLYAKKAQKLTQKFKSCEISQIPLSMVEEADELAKPAIQGPASESTLVIMLHHPSIQEGCEVFMIDEKDSWKTPIIRYLKNNILPKNKNEARNLKF